MKAICNFIGKLFFAITILLCTSCTTFLEETPYSFVPEEQLFVNATSAEVALTGVYDILNASSVHGIGNHNLFGRGLPYMNSVGTDELIVNPTLNDNEFRQFGNYTYTSESLQCSYAWFFLYAGIHRANGVIEKVPSITMNENRKKEIIAEASFLRGFYQFYLTWLFGGVPAPRKQGTDGLAARQPIKQVLDYVEQDLLKAYNELPAINPVDSARLNKYAAGALLVKLYLYEASCKENKVATNNFPLNSFDEYDATALYQKAVVLAKNIYDNSGYKLIDEYRYLFLADTEAEGRKENMFVVQAGPGGGQTDVILYVNLAIPQGSRDITGGGYGYIRPLIELKNLYHANDLRGTNNYVGSLPSNASTETINGVKYFVPTAVNSSRSNVGLGKFRLSDPQIRMSQGLGNTAGTIDWPVIRFADLILMYAEAKYKTGDELTARGLLWEVRSRACKKNATVLQQLMAAYLKANFMDELMDERSRELCGEGWRRFDLIRTGRIASAIAALNETAPTFNATAVPEIKANFQSYKIWYPIPKREIETNPNLLPNNPGYGQ